MIPRRRAMRKEDFPGQEQWIEPLLRMIGDFNSQTVSAMTDGLTFSENMNATLQSLTVTLRSDWTSVGSFSNSWASFGSPYFAPQYRRVGDMVELRGALANGTLGSAAFTLPATCCPAATAIFPANAYNSTAEGHAAVAVAAAGAVTPSSASGYNVRVNLDGVRFQAGASGTSPNGAFPITYAHKLAGGKKAAGVWCVAAQDITAGEQAATYASTRVAWKPDGENVQVHDLPDLVAGRKYTVTLLTIAG